MRRLFVLAYCVHEGCKARYRKGVLNRIFLLVPP